MSGFGAEVIFAGASRTLAHSDIVVGGSSYSSAGRLLVGSGTSAETLKLGAASKLQLLSGATISGDALVNDGVIEASAGFQATLTLQTLTNAGLIDLDGTGGSFQIGAQIGTFTNSGTLDVSNQISLDFKTQFDGPAETWTSTGVVDVTNATLTLGGTLTTASLNTVDAGTGGVINLDENLQNGGATLDLAHFAAGTLSLGGTISGGTLAADGGTLGLALGGDAGWAGVVVQGDLALGGDSTLQVTGGLTLDAGSASAGTLNTAGVQVNFAGSQGVTGGEIAFGTIGVLAEGAGLTTLDLNPQTELVQATVFASLLNGGTGTPLVANGNLIEAGVAGGTLLISGIHLGNYGEFLAEDGDSVEVAGGTFTNAGTLSLAGTGTAFTLGDDSEATAFDNSAHVSIAGGVLNDGDPGGGLDTGNVWANTGTIAVDGGVLSLNAACSTGGLGAIIVSDGGSVALRGALDNSGATLTLGTGTALGALALLYGTISGGTIVDLGGGIVARGGVLDGVTYDGVLDLSAASATLGIAGGLTMHGSNGAGTSSILLTGAGSDLVFAGGDSETLNDTTLSFGAADRLTVNETEFSAETTLNLGSALHIDGAQNAQFAGTGMIVNDTVLEGASSTGTIGISTAEFTNAGTVSVSAGEQGDFSGFVFSNTGVMEIGSGSAFTLGAAANVHAASPALNNAGSLELAGGTLGAPVVAGGAPVLSNEAGGVISGYGAITGSLANTGVVEAAGGTLTLQQAVSGAGTLKAEAGASLVLAGGVSAGEIVQFAGAAATIGLAPMAFLGEVAGIAAGERIDLLNTEASAASFVGSSIVVTLSAGGTLVLDTSTALTGSITTSAGTDGGTILTFAGVQDGVVAHATEWAGLQVH